MTYGKSVTRYCVPRVKLTFTTQPHNKTYKTEERKQKSRPRHGQIFNIFFLI
jgi:hypothetical protein